MSNIVTSETSVQPRQPVSPAEMQRIIGAYARLKEISAKTIIDPKEDAEKVGLTNYLTNALLANAEELFGAWVAVNQEYSPLIQGFTSLLNRALSRIDSANRNKEVVAPETK